MDGDGTVLQRKKKEGEGLRRMKKKIVSEGKKKKVKFLA